MELPGKAKVLIPELSVVLPVFNHESQLPTTISEATSALDSVCGDWELIVIDDGSTDSSAEILQRLASEDPRLRVLTQPKSLGYGTAIRRGFDAARFLIVGTTEADGRYDLGDFARLYPMLRSAHLAVGYRHREADAPRPGIASRLFSSRVRSGLGIDARDMDCALRLYRRSLLHMIEPTTDGRLFHAEILARTAGAGLEWTETEVECDTHRVSDPKFTFGMLLQGLKELRQLKRQI
jgi:dolichol-phosphate mannosyltransferase